MPQGAGPKKKCAVAHPFHVSNLHTKFGLGGDSVTDGRTDRRTEAIAISPTLFLKKRGDNELFHAWTSNVKVFI